MKTQKQNKETITFLDGNDLEERMDKELGSKARIIKEISATVKEMQKKVDNWNPNQIKCEKCGAELADDHCKEDNWVTH